MRFCDKIEYVWGLRYRWDPSLSRNLIPRFPHFVPPCDLPTIHIDLLYLNLNLYVYIYLYVYVYIYIFHIDVSLQQPLLYLSLNLYLNSTVHKDLSLPQPPLYLNLNLYIYLYVRIRICIPLRIRIGIPLRIRIHTPHRSISTSASTLRVLCNLPLHLPPDRSAPGSTIILGKEASWCEGSQSSI